MHELWRAGIFILMTSHQGIVHNISMDKNKDLRQDMPVRLIHSFVTVNCTYFESARVSLLALGLRVTCSPGCFLCPRPEKMNYKFKKRQVVMLQLYYLLVKWNNYINMKIESIAG